MHTQLHDEVRTHSGRVAADRLHDEIREIAGNLFQSTPTVISTGRLGGFDGAWDARGVSTATTDDTATPVPRHVATGHHDLTALAALVIAYADHEDADQQIITRYDGRFPACVNLYIG